MRIPGAAGHQQHRLVFEFAQGVGDMQGIGHDDQTRLLAKLGDHGGRGAAAVNNDAGMLADAFDGSTGNRLFVL